MLTEGVGEEVERPSDPSFRRFAASQRRKPRFGLTVELAAAIRPAGPVVQCRRNTVGHGTFAQSLDRGTTHLDGFSDLGVGPLLLLGTPICLEEDASTGDGARGGSACPDRLLEEQAFGIGEGDDIELDHGEALLGRDVWCVRWTALPPVAGQTC